jgi:hypothetical protein
MNRQQYKDRIKELEDKLAVKEKELCTALELWAQVVSHKKDEPSQKRMKIFGGSTFIKNPLE